MRSREIGRMSNIIQLMKLIQLRTFKSRLGGIRMIRANLCQVLEGIRFLWVEGRRAQQRRRSMDVALALVQITTQSSSAFLTVPHLEVWMGNI